MEPTKQEAGRTGVLVLGSESGENSLDKVLDLTFLDSGRYDKVNLKQATTRKEPPLPVWVSVFWWFGDIPDSYGPSKPGMAIQLPPANVFIHSGQL